MSTIGFCLTPDNYSHTAPGGDTGNADTFIETPIADRAWHMCVSLPSRPRCFGCGGRMLPKGVVIVSNFAVCKLCSDHPLSDYFDAWLAIESLGCTLEITRSRGIVFWTPPGTLPDHDAYLRWMELWQIKTQYHVSDRRQLQRRGLSVFADPNPAASGTDGC